MFSEEFLKILRCPVSHTPVAVAEEGLIERLNAAIQSGQLQNRAGKTVEQNLEAGLVNETGTLLYPVCGGVPSMLVDEVIPLAQLSSDCSEEGGRRDDPE